MTAGDVEAFAKQSDEISLCNVGIAGARLMKPRKKLEFVQRFTSQQLFIRVLDITVIQNVFLFLRSRRLLQRVSTSY